MRGFVSVLALAAAAGVASTASADVLSISFTGSLTSYNGPASQDPFDPSTPLGGSIAAFPDLAKFDAQIVVRNFDPSFTGSYSFGPGGSSGNVEFFLHTPILERIEALTTRLGDSSPNGFSEDTKLLLPRNDFSTTTDEVNVTTTGFFGSGSLEVVNGVPVGITYNQGASTLQSFDFRFNPLSLEELDIATGANTSFDAAGQFDLDTAGASDSVPYGFNTTLANFPGSTVLTTTRATIESELAAGNLLDAKQSSGGQPLANPFAGLTGTWFQYNAGGFDASVVVIPAPAGASMLVAGGLLAGRRRR